MLRIDPKEFIGPTQIGKLLTVMLSDAKFKLVRIGGWLVVTIENIAISTSSLGLGLAKLGKIRACCKKVLKKFLDDARNLCLSSIEISKIM